MSESSPASPFVYNSQTRSVQSVDPGVTILADKFEGGSDGYSAYAVAISRGPYTYCFYAVDDYLKDDSGKYLLTTDRRPVGVEFTHVLTRAQFRDRRSGVWFASNFPDDENSYREAAALAVNFYSSAKMLRPDVPIRRIEFYRSEKVNPKIVEVGDSALQSAIRAE